MIEFRITVPCRGPLKAVNLRSVSPDSAEFASADPFVCALTPGHAADLAVRLDRTQARQLAEALLWFASLKDET